MVTPEYGYTYADLIVKCGMGGGGGGVDISFLGRLNTGKLKS